MPAQLAPAAQYLPDVPGRGWTPIRVPANWYKEGRDLQGAAWYRRRFDVPADMGGKLLRLVFDGVDYAADVWLNGHYVGFHEGYFQRFDFDITALVQPGGNTLVVRVDSPFEIPGKAWSLRKRLIKGVFNHHDARPGGAWATQEGQDANTGGIWAGVRLEATEGAAIRAMTANGQWLPKPVVRLALSVHSTESRTMTIAATIAPRQGGEAPPPFEQPVTLKAGDNRIELEVPAPGVMPWWPAQMGAAVMYDFAVELRGEGRVVDAATAGIGFRNVVCDDKGIWSINGVRLFLRGTNYIGTQWLSEMTAEDYRRDIGLLLGCNCNAVRVHAHVACRDFYRLCDEMGMLVWQDYPLQWGYEDTAEFHHQAVSQLRDMISELGGHPSVVCWSLHNETPWDAEWMQYKYPDWVPGQNKELDDKMLVAGREADPTRHVHPFSGTTEHPWAGWYWGSYHDFAKPFSLPIATEFGAQALPNKEGLIKMFGEENIWPETDAQWKLWKYHNFQPEETFTMYANIDKGKSVEEFIANTQHYQAWLSQYAAECFRRQRYTPMGGCFHFMLCEPWPSINWGIVDYWRQPKAGYAALKRAFQPVLPSIEWHEHTWPHGQPVTAKLWVINDLQDSYAGATLAWQLMTDAGHLIASGKAGVDVTPDSMVLVEDWRRDGLGTGGYRLQVSLADAAGKTLGDNEWVFKVE
jgi:beta-mannosidase